MYIQLNLGDLKEVNTFVERFKNLGLPLHGLVNNAGLGFGSRAYTSNGFEVSYGNFTDIDCIADNTKVGGIQLLVMLQSNKYLLLLGVNHLGHFALTLQLLDKLRETNGKVVTVSSALHKRGW